MSTPVTLVQLGPLQQLRADRLPRRLIQLVAGLTLCGISMAMMIRGGYGLAPWDSLHLGMSRQFTISFGEIVILMSFLVLLLWIPLREKPGVGTVANAVIIGAVADYTLGQIHIPGHIGLKLAYSVGGVLLCGVGSALYIGAQLGRGPRDGLMTSLHRLTGLSLQVVRTGIEVSVLSVGLLMGGTGLFGFGTILFALCIGPLTQAMLPFVLVPPGTKTA